ncbi:MAG: sarcosine oxidase subunit delta [Allosphingosinicella sp.]|uniref:sarcosine oxidase subunit delta n=1 Tax=Allosphingosinicella sp. TaxID=2823234 RepID=UPI0039453BCF
MLRIHCPWCGARDEIEFRCGGESHIERPEPDVSDATWAAYLFERDNPRGARAERWVHSAGCRQWFNLVRDTVTHEIHEVYRMGSRSIRLEKTNG